MNRFHSKFHRKNHHTKPDLNNPDAGHDPIASQDAPFQGNFFLNGSLSASGSLMVSGINALSGSFAGTATLGTGGTTTVTNYNLKQNCLIFLTTQVPSGTVGSLYISNTDLVYSKFTISSTQTADRSTVAWFMVQTI